MAAAGPQSPMADHTACVMCGSAGSLTCNSCFDSQYCSKNCQKLDWPLHKALCKTAKEFTHATRPPVEFADMTELVAVYKRGIFLPDQEDKPRFYWQRFELLPENYGRGSSNAIMGEFPDGVTDLTPADCVVADTVAPGLFIPGIALASRFPLSQQVSTVGFGQVNKSIEKIDKDIAAYIRGPLVAFAFNGPKLNQQFYTTDNPLPWHDRLRDLGPRDLRKIMDFLRYRCDWIAAKATTICELAAPMTKAVRLPCRGEMFMERLGDLPSIDVPVSFCSGNTDFTCDVASKIGIPLVMIKSAYAPYWEKRTLLADDQWITNPYIHNIDTELFLSNGFEPNDGAPTTLAERFVRGSDFLKLKDGQDTLTGPIIVARQDGKPLSPLVIKSLANYMRRKTYLMIIKTPSPTHWKENLLNDVSRDDWKEFYAAHWEKMFSEYALAMQHVRDFSSRVALMGNEP